MASNVVDRLARLALAATAVALLAAPVASAGAPIHEFAAEECAPCHPGLRTGDLTSPPPVTGRIHAQCVKCHSACEPARVHGSGRNVPAAMVSPLPLDAAGTIDCRTCHATHPPESPSAPGHHLLRIVNLRRELCLNCHQERKPGTVSVIAPPPGVTVREAELLLAGTAEDDRTATLRVRLNGVSFPLPLKSGAFSTWLTIQEGVNRVEILEEDAVLWATEVFRPGAAAVNGTGYRRLHRGHLTGRGECADCHGPDPRGYELVASPTASALCYRCHERFEGRRYLHGPVAVGACLSCHDPHGGLGSAALREEQSGLCLSCHPKGDVRHCVTGEAAGAQECTRCHDPHASDAKFFRKGEAPRPAAFRP